jgi:acyl-CoA synthetase (NDP forming)
MATVLRAGRTNAVLRDGSTVSIRSLTPADEAALLSFGNPRKFSRIARRVGRTKPIIAVKSGRSAAGVRATQSHTGSLLAASDVTVDAPFRQAGVIRTDTLGELFDVAVLLSTQPPPAGPRIGIVTNAGGPGILCADACQAEGLDVPPLSETTVAALREFLPPQASVGNPVDMLASAPAAHYLQAIRAVSADPNVDAVIAIFIPPVVTQPEDAAEVIVQAARELAGTTPVLTVFMSSSGVPTALRGAVAVPSYAFPEDAAIALARVVRYGQWRARPPVDVPRLAGLQRDAAASTVATALGRGTGWLEPDEVAALLAGYGLPVAAQHLVRSPADAAAAAAALQGPVALKAIGPGLLHKTDLGAVRLNLRGPTRRGCRCRRDAGDVGGGGPARRWLPRAGDGASGGRDAGRRRLRPAVRTRRGLRSRRCAGRAAQRRHRPPDAAGSRRCA